MEPRSQVLDFEGRPINLITTLYADRVFVVVNELPSFGTLISATVETYPDGAVEFELRTLVGDREEELLSLLARRLVEGIYRDTGLPLLLAVGLRSPSDALVRAILSGLESSRPWASGAAAPAGGAGKPAVAALGAAP